MKLSYQIHKFNLKEIFSISYGNYTFRNALLVTLSQNGKSGYGECTEIDYYNINLKTYLVILEKIKLKIESQNIEHPNQFYFFLETLNLPSFLRSALDCAYWDLFGKLENKSFLDLNSISTLKVPESSITISVAEISEQIKKIEKSHWNQFKVKCKGFSEKNITEFANLNRNIALDSNASFTIENCIQLEEMEVSKKFTYLEQPMEVGEENFSKLTLNSNTNWMADEDLQGIETLEVLKNHYKTINVKLVKCGGLTPAMQLIEAAKKLNFKIMIGCMTESTIGISAGAVLAPLCDYVDLDGANLIENDIANGTKILNGKIELSESNGLGIELI